MNVLCVTDYFLPGFHGGGPITTLANMRKQLAGDVELSMFTRDRDLGALEPYPHIQANHWSETPDGAVFYATPDLFGPSGLRKALAGRPAQLLYLNSFFSPYSSIFSILLRSWVAPGLPILLAPRGEFSPGALAVKSAKKRIFIWFARMLDIYKDVYWHASTEFELRDILRQFPGSGSHIYVAPDPVLAAPIAAASGGGVKKVNQLNSVFISRISPKKNLDGLLTLLSKVRARVNLDIFGPIEELDYWRKCERMFSALPKNITVKYYGPVSPEMIPIIFSRYDLFIFPTLGENFGHVIFESLCAGTPVLVSDRTPWHPDDSGAMTVLPLDNIVRWCTAIEHAAERTAQEQVNVRVAAHNYASSYVSSDTSMKANVDMFNDLVLSR
jgi:glycosyltransferase involved in cell wall biosynthesis